MLEGVKTLLTEWVEIPAGIAARDAVAVAGIALAATLFYYITKFVLGLVEKLIARSSTEWDDDLLNPRLMRAISQLSPALAVNWLLPALWHAGKNSVHWLEVLTSLYILWTIIRILVIFVENLFQALTKRQTTSPYAVKGVFQMFKLVFIGVGVIVGLSMVIGRSPVAILTALGASAAVLMLVFKDTIMGLVASVQLTANKMVHRGDWIASEKLGFNGEVIDVTLTTVKVRNWDNTVSTIPPYTLVTDSFRNYQPMKRSGARRVSRPVYIDSDSIRFLTPDELAELKQKGMLSPQAAQGADNVNLRLLRLYLEDYLRAHDKVRQDLTLMVRQLEPTPHGLPVEIYCFTNENEWVSYEHIQSDIFDHVYA
ncbi:MAG: mechanosensitive ion channel family protein, partial [Muribaculaceae bacterium]|nr:mechanosensitive ion channel family protein [Muribaculaceae bacterium]